GAPINPNTMIRIEIKRNDEKVFAGEISINRMKRKHNELAEYLFRETSFPYGVFLMTGTGVVPPDHFTLRVDDEIEIWIDGIGALINRVSQ
ncbi:MAG TPA: fumarylacetoacetate hydrolase family protein, partial [Chitinophagaceae bacterium]